MKKHIFILILICLSVTAFAQSDSKGDVSYPKFTLCKHLGEARSIAVETKPSGGCLVKYTKMGVEQKVGESWTESRCVKIMESIEKNLISAGWKCKMTADVQSHNSEEPKKKK